MASHKLQLESSSSSPQPLPSLPPSPTEEDLGRPAAWTADEPHTLILNSPTKGKSSIRGEGYADEEYEMEEEEAQSGVAGYPPMTDEEAESRRIEENLRRWEIAERERRRAARGSAQASSSAVGDVVKRASSLWSKRSSRIPKDGAGRHAVLRERSSEDGVALSDIDGSPVLSVAHSPDPSIYDFSTESENPFANPKKHPVSPFDDVHQASAIMAESSSIPPTPAAEGSDSKDASHQLIPSRRVSVKPPPPPEPLGLPEPKAPPPCTGSPVANRAPEPIPSPSLTPVPAEQQEEERPARWWTDWLCGCSEGPDRGGDNQAGKTNPME